MRAYMKYMMNSYEVGENMEMIQSYNQRAGQDPDFAMITQKPKRIMPKYGEAEYIFNPKNIIDCHVGFDEYGKKEIVLDYHHKMVRLHYNEDILKAIRIAFGDNPNTPPYISHSVSSSQ